MSRIVLPRRRALAIVGASALAAIGCGGDPASAPPVVVARRRERTVRRIVDARPTMEGAGVRLRRALGSRELSFVDPFLLLDEIHATRREDADKGFPTHPHRGFETVTYVVHGQVEHQDSLGNKGRIGAGAVQWMTAGRGIVHAEMPKQDDELLWGFQLWVNLPSSRKMTRPRYQDLAAERVAVARVEGADLRVLAGDVAGHRGPVGGVVTAPLFVDVSVARGERATLPVPEGHAAFVYVFEGEARLGPDGAPVRAGQLAVLEDGASLRVRGEVDRARLLLAAARPIGEPVARRGPFVMNTEAEIETAIADYRAGRLVDG